MMRTGNAGRSAGGQNSAGERMKEQGSQVAQGAAHTGQQFAHSAAQQGRQVAMDAGRQARGLVDQAQSEVKGQAADQQKRAASGLRAIGDQLRSMAEQSGQQGPASELVQQASQRTQRVADWLEQREPGQVVDEVRGFARRHPGAFLTGAAIAGVLAGRLTRNLAGGDGAMGTRDTSQSATGGSDMNPMARPPTAAAVPPPAAQAAGTPR